MTPNHDLFRQIFKVTQKHCKTYDYLPDAGAKYPFVYMGEQNGSEIPSSDLYGTIRQSVHIYGLRTDRGNLDDISAYLESEVKRVRHGYGYHFAHRSTNKQVIPDNTDVQPLLHIVLDFTFDFTKKEG